MENRQFPGRKPGRPNGDRLLATEIGGLALYLGSIRETAPSISALGYFAAGTIVEIRSAATIC